MLQESDLLNKVFSFRGNRPVLRGTKHIVTGKSVMACVRILEISHKFYLNLCVRVFCGNMFVPGTYNKSKLASPIEVIATIIMCNEDIKHLQHQKPVLDKLNAIFDIQCKQAEKCFK